MRCPSRFTAAAAQTRWILVVLTFAALATAQVEVRVEDDDPAIVYTPLTSWYRNEIVNPMDSGGYHMVTDDATATATFRFRGTGIQYWAPLWADVITTQLTLDGGIPETISLQDMTQVVGSVGGTTVESSMLWSQQGLADIEHELVFSVAPGGQFSVVDALVVTQLETEVLPEETTTDLPVVITETSASSSTATSSSTTSSSTRRNLFATPSPEASPTPETTAGLTIGIAVVSSLGGVLLICLLLFWLRRRRQARREREVWLANYQNAAQQPPPPNAMAEIDDSIAQGKGRYRSVPSRHTLRSYLEDMDRESGLYSSGNGSGSIPVGGTMTPSLSASGSLSGAAANTNSKGTSKLRQVVATEDGAKPVVAAGEPGPYTPETNGYPRT